MLILQQQFYVVDFTLSTLSILRCHVYIVVFTLLGATVL